MEDALNEAILSLIRDIEKWEEVHPHEVTEAVLTTKGRENLPASAFCGPNRTYPANDAIHVRNALVRLSQFGGKLKPSVRKRIFSCLVGKAKKFGVTISDETKKKYRNIGESETSTDEWIDWLLAQKT